MTPVSPSGPENSIADGRTVTAHEKALQRRLAGPVIQANTHSLTNQRKASCEINWGKFPLIIAAGGRLDETRSLGNAPLPELVTISEDRLLA